MLCLNANCFCGSWLSILHNLCIPAVTVKLREMGRLGSIAFNFRMDYVEVANEVALQNLVVGPQPTATTLEAVKQHKAPVYARPANKIRPL